MSVDDVSVELRYFCRRFQQLGLLYRVLATKTPVQAEASPNASSASPATPAMPAASLEEVVEVGMGGEA